MADRNIPEQVSDTMEGIEEYSGVNVPKATAKTITKVYAQAALAAATALPLVLGTIGPVPTISPQEPTKRPDEHQASQTQHGPEMEIEEALVSAPDSLPPGIRLQAESGVIVVSAPEAQITRSLNPVHKDTAE
jgi:hypothetical protein